MAETTCRRCSECEGAEHHFLEHCDDPAATPAGEEPFAGYICKHCEQKADMCDECSGPIWPHTGQTVCADCTAGRGDFE